MKAHAHFVKYKNRHRIGYKYIPYSWAFSTWIGKGQTRTRYGVRILGICLSFSRKNNCSLGERVKE